MARHIPASFFASVRIIMKAIRYILILLLLSCVLKAAAQTTGPSAQPATRHHLMPVPASVRFNPGRLSIGKSFNVAARGKVDTRLQSAIDRAVRRLEGRTLMEFQRGLASDANTATLLVETQGPGKVVPAVDEDESYSLEVSDRQAVLRAPT